MKTVKAVVFDFIGTLATVEGYSYENSERKLYESLVGAGFNMHYKRFKEAYEKAHQKYRIIRYQELVEVTNAVWVSEALNMLGYKTTPNDENIYSVINVFFEDYIQSLNPRPNVTKVLENLSTRFTLGLISNFTYAPVIHTSIEKLGLSKYFNSILVSQDFGWRKPSAKIFREILKRLGVNGNETVYVGDSPEEDIKGAQEIGIKTVFIPSQFYSLTDLEKTKVRPDLVIKNLEEVLDLLPC